eukprot:5778592-Amphidinium_carterae.1
MESNASLTVMILPGEVCPLKMFPDFLWFSVASFLIGMFSHSFSPPHGEANAACLSPCVSLCLSSLSVFQSKQLLCVKDCSTTRPSEPCAPLCTVCSLYAAYPQN